MIDPALSTFMKLPLDHSWFLTESLASHSLHSEDQGYSEMKQVYSVFDSASTRRNISSGRNIQRHHFWRQFIGSVSRGWPNFLILVKYH